MNSRTDKGGASDYVRKEVVGVEAHLILRVDASPLEPRIELLTGHFHGKMGMDGMIEGKPVSIPLVGGSSVTLVSEDLVEELQRQASGRVQVTRPFEWNTGALTAFGQELA